MKYTFKLITILLISSFCFAEDPFFKKEDQDLFKNESILKKDPIFQKEIIKKDSKENTNSPSSLFENQDSNFFQEEKILVKEESEVKEKEITEDQLRKVNDLFNTRGNKIKYISLIINADKILHTRQNIQRIHSLSKKHNLKIKDVYLIGNYHLGIDPQYLTSVFVMGGKLNLNRKVPKKYGAVSKSPAWILGTKDGDVIIEGINEIERYINNKGEFVEKLYALTAGLKGFEPVVSKKDKFEEYYQNIEKEFEARFKELIKN